MYFEVYVNGERLGTYGHPHVENLTVSVSGSPDGSYVFAGAVCREGEQRFHFDWLQRNIAPTDEVRIISVNHGTAPDPIKKFEMGRTARKA